MMAGTSFTFRCVQCGRLLGISHQRVGSHVACPRCGTEQVVPSPGQGPEQVSNSGEIASDSGAASRAAPSAAARTPDPTAAKAEPQAWALGGVDTGFPGIRIEPEPISLRPGASAAVTAAAPTATATRGPETATRAPSPAPAPAQVAPQPARSFSGETASAAGPAPRARRNDVFLPRTAVMLWSFGMLLALVFAFAAGVLAGHFLWVGGA